MYEEINIKVLIDKIIPNSLAAIRYRRGMPINIILCNSITREEGEYDIDEETVLMEHLKGSETHPSLYEIACTPWAKKCCIRLLVQDGQQQSSTSIRVPKKH